MDDPIRLPITDVFDLHSVPPRDVADVVREYLMEARHRGFRALRIIHGRGIGVQREIVHSLLKTLPDVLSFRDMPDRGSTLVELRVHSPS